MILKVEYDASRKAWDAYWGKENSPLEACYDSKGPIGFKFAQRAVASEEWCINLLQSYYVQNLDNYADFVNRDNRRPMMKFKSGSRFELTIGKYPCLYMMRKVNTWESITDYFDKQLLKIKD